MNNWKVELTAGRHSLAEMKIQSDSLALTIYYSNDGNQGKEMNKG